MRSTADAQTDNGSTRASGGAFAATARHAPMIWKAAGSPIAAARPLMRALGSQSVTCDPAVGHGPPSLARQLHPAGHMRKSTILYPPVRASDSSNAGS